MIIVAPQLSDWGTTSANQAVALTEYFIGNYNIDRSRVYANGYSGGGETLSLVMDRRPDLFAAILHAARYGMVTSPMSQAAAHPSMSS